MRWQWSRRLVNLSTAHSCESCHAITKSARCYVGMFIWCIWMRSVIRTATCRHHCHYSVPLPSRPHRLIVLHILTHSFDFPDDPESWQVKDVYMFGPTMLAAPVTDMGARNRTLYLPSPSSGQVWEHYFTKKTYSGGANVTVAAPLDEFPLFSLKSAIENSE